MEITGIDGTYRYTCESVMKVLRHNKDSLMAVLEAFVYDPLLNWKLLETNPKATRTKSRAGGGATGESLMNSVVQDPGEYLETLPTAPVVGSLSTANKKGPPEELGDNSAAPPPEALNKKAIAVVNKVKEKLTGRDFSSNEEPCKVPEQVKALIQQATSHENLCQCYIGWCPFW